MGGPAPTPLIAEAEDLLGVLARRTMAGPVRRTPGRDQLRKRGLIESYTPDFRTGQDTHWVLTPLGLAYLAKQKASA